MKPRTGKNVRAERREREEMPLMKKVGTVVNRIPLGKWNSFNWMVISRKYNDTTLPFHSIIFFCYEKLFSSLCLTQG